MKERERRRGKREKSREREIEIRYTEMEIEGGDELGTRREKQRRERGKTRLLSDFPPPSVPSPDSEHRNRRHTQESPFRPFTCHHQIVEIATGYFFPLSYIWVFWLDRYRFRYLLRCFGIFYYNL